MSERIRARYLLRPARSLELAADQLAHSMGGYCAAGAVESAHELDDGRAEVEISIPPDLVGNNLPALADALLGGPFELDALLAVRLVHLDVPCALVAGSPGPAFGIAGTRRLAGVLSHRPVIGTIIKPSVGLTPEATAARVRELAAAGIDFIKDDELLTSSTNSRLADRVRAVVAVIEEVADKAGRRVMFAFNISSDNVEQLLRNHDLVAEAGGTCVMVSVNHVGLAAVARLRRYASLPLHAHRNGWGALTRCPDHGLEFQPFQALWRLAGVDHLHVNGFDNKFWEPDPTVTRSIQACLAPLHGMPAIMPVVSSGQWGGQAPAQYAATHTVDVMYLAGGGIQGHPQGPAAGVRAVRAAWRAAVDGVALADRAPEEPELAAALERFGGIHGR